MSYRDDVDAMLPQVFGWTYAGQQQNVGRADGAAAQNHFPPRANDSLHPGFLEGDADGALTLEQDPFCKRTRDDPQIGPFHRGFEVADRG